MISLTVCVIGVVVTRACTGCETGPPLFSVVVTVLRGRVCFLVVNVEAPDLFLNCVRCEVGGIVALLWGEKPLSFPYLELFTHECTLLYHYFTHCVGS